jgi:hypothetical protein
MKILLIFLITFVISFNVNGINWWNGYILGKNKFQIKINVGCKNDILTLFENRCLSCYFEDKIMDLKKGDTLLLKYIPLEEILEVYLNDELITLDKNPNECFFCIQNNFK